MNIEWKILLLDILRYFMSYDNFYIKDRKWSYELFKKIFNMKYEIFYTQSSSGLNISNVGMNKNHQSKKS